jgi:energy-converting hydrogenase Eha subunit G
MELLPSMYPIKIECLSCGATNRIPYGWTFMSHFFTGAIAGGALIFFLHSVVSKAVLLSAWTVLYVGGSIGLNWWYFRLGHRLEPPN